MRIIAATALIVALSATAAFASTQSDAKRELEGWGKAASAYEKTCGAGKLREQMPREKANEAYECFSEIIDKNVQLQYPDLYAKLSEGMKEAHAEYAEGKLDWTATLDKLREASDDYNAAVANRNKQGSYN
jgi:hypothetical protein